MAEVEFSTTARVAVGTIWDFVREMDNWAPMLTGYQSHEKQSDDDSVWVLKGDVGSLTRILEFRVHVREWAGPERVDFELDGVNEQMKGEGQFRMEPFEDETAAAAAPAAAQKGPLSRLIEAILRFLFKRVHGETERGADANAGPGAGMAKLSFRLRLDPGGPMAPMINAMMRPAMAIAAEDLANKIIGELESRTDSD